MIKAIILFVTGCLVTSLVWTLIKISLEFVYKKTSFCRKPIFQAAYRHLKKESTVTTVTNVVVAIIGGLAVAILSPYINETYEVQRAKELLPANLQKIQIGMSRSKIEEYFGSPLVNNAFLGDYQDIDLNEDGKVDSFNFTSAGYKLNDTDALLCMYRDETLDAFVVIGYSRDLYQVSSLSNRRLVDKEKQLGEFTYSDFAKDIEDAVKIEAMDGNHGNYFYTEIYGGSQAELNQYEIIGNYSPNLKMYSQEELDRIYALVGNGTSYFLGVTTPENTSYTDNDLNSYLLEIKKCREYVEPNVYGRVNYTIADRFNYINDIIRGDYVLLFYE